MNHLLKSPVITERSLEATKLNKYTFKVSPSATKYQIRQAIEQQFGVNVVRVNTTTIRGTEKRTGRRRLPTMAKTFKKAVVEIKAGQKIAIFETQG